MAWSRAAAGLLLVGLAAVVGGTFRAPWGVGAAGAAALLLGAATWVPSAARVPAAALFVLDLAWITAAALCAGRADAGFSLFYPLVAFAAGLAVGRKTAGVLAGAAVAALAAASWLLGAIPHFTGQVVLQGLLILILSAAAARVRTIAQSRERALVHASRALERMRLDTDSIVENLGSGLLSVDATGRIVHVNRVAAETLGREAAAARGLTLSEVFRPGSEALVGVIEDGLATGSPVQRREVTVDRNGVRIPLGLGTTILRDGDGRTTGVAVLFQDLTDVYRQQEVERRRERLAAIGELAAGIAHEIRNSILPVSGSVQLLVQELEPRGEQRKLFEVIERETDNVERFVSSLLSYTRLQNFRPAAVDLLALAEEVAAEPGPNRPEGIQVRVDGEPAWAWADGEQVRQVIRNLLANAMDASGGGGVVRMRVGPDGDGTVRLEVEDEGPGIPDDAHEAVFRPFFTTKKGGTGLGLSVVSRIVEDHDGAIVLERARGGGALFRVTLPAPAQEAGARAA